tara:strand:- start:73300 stop:73572 length:273 start_codon:yes stop_codon:yes gene_type:complete
MQILSKTELNNISGGIEVSGLSAALGVMSFTSAFAVGKWNRARTNASYFANHAGIEQALHTSNKEIAATVSKIIDDSNLSSPSDANVKVY